MARPRQNAEGPSACERLIAAFWEMLGQMPFDDITVCGISRVAHVSPNTLYYHFDGLFDIAREAVRSELSKDVAKSLIGNNGEGRTIAQLMGNPRDALRLSRMGLVAASGSAMLTAMLTAMLKEAWCDLSGRPLSSLTEAEAMDLDFVYGGLVTVLRRANREEPAKLAAFLARPLGKGIAATMANLSSPDIAEGVIRQNPPGDCDATR